MAHPEAVLSTGQLERYEAVVARREAGEPVAYIRGAQGVLRPAISVDARVLIPRPETETLVELALARISDDLTGAPRDATPSPTWCGTWAPAPAPSRWPSASELRRRRYGDVVRFFVSDISGDARDVATINVVSHGLAHLFTFAEGDLTDVAPAPPRPVDLLVGQPALHPLRRPSRRCRWPPASSRSARSTAGPTVSTSCVACWRGCREVLAPARAALLEIGGDQVER